MIGGMPAGYDEWKTRTPWDDYEEPCEHPPPFWGLRYDGTYECACGEECKLTDDEFAAHRAEHPEFDRAIREYEAEERARKRRYWWRVRRERAVRAWWRTVHAVTFGRYGTIGARAYVIDEDIPF
jgi:hypothetical protein